MTVTVHIYPNDRLFLEVPNDAGDVLTDDSSRLSVDERIALLDEFSEKFMEFIGHDFPPLSDYATSREGIYEDHP